MKEISLENLTICQYCGCVWNYIIGSHYVGVFDNIIVVCPACNNEHELPNNNK